VSPLTGMWFFAPSWSGPYVGILVHQAGIIDSRNVSLETVQIEGTVDIAWGFYQPRLEWRIEMADSAVKEAVNGGTKISDWDFSLKDIVSAVEDYADGTRRAVRRGRLAAEEIVSAVEDYSDGTRRAVRRGRLAAEELIDEAAHSIKQRPLQTVALTFGLAFGTGVLFGWIASRTREK
jgi:hypothetical protein